MCLCASSHDRVVHGLQPLLEVEGLYSLNSYTKAGKPHITPLQGLEDLPAHSLPDGKQHADELNKRVAYTSNNLRTRRH